MAGLACQEEQDWEAISARLTELLRTPNGKMKLRAIQGQALWTLGQHRMLFGAIGVGHGKTIISLLAPYVLGLKNPILMLPAALIPKTEHERRELSNHWRIPMALRMVSYEEMGREGAATLLESQRPDGIIADECHRLKSSKAGVTKRVARYMKAFPDTVFAAMSGSMMVKSLLDYAHILRWTHKHLAPVPSTKEETEEWAGALDEIVNPLQRVDPGPMLAWAPPGEYDGETQRARRGWNRRLTATPGVVATADANVTGASLYITAHILDVNPVTDANFNELRVNWRTPDGWWHSEAAITWIRARELALGFHAIWQPRPPDSWLDARREWAAYAREILSRSRTLDTEEQVKIAIDEGKLFTDTLARWRQVEPTFRVNPVDVWHDDSALNWCQRWMAKGPGIVWVKHVFFGHELSRRTGALYFQEKGIAANGASLHVIADEVRARRVKAMPIICAVDACSTGLNLQPWNRNLITAPAPGNKEWEQLLGRTYRAGQEANEVTADVLIGCRENWESLQKAFLQAQSTADNMGQRQRLQLADKILPRDVDMRSLTGYRWKENSAKETP